MIPIDKIVPGNPYSQDDAAFLMGKGLSQDAAKEIVCEACRSGQLKASKWRKRWWFTGRAFIDWVARWFGAEIESDDDSNEEGEGPLARVLRLGGNGPAKQEPVAVPEGGR